MSVMECDIAILGGGCVGMSILHELARLDLGHIVLLDKGCEASSASAKSGGMLRIFHENPKHIDLALAHHHRFLQLEKDGVFSAQSDANGSLYFFHRNRLPAYENGLKIMTAADYPFEVIAFEEGKKRFPEFRWNRDELAIYEPLARQLEPKLFLADLCRESQRSSSVNVLRKIDVQRICSYRNHYVLCSKDLTLLAKSLVLSGGAACLPRLKDLGLKLPLESKVLTSFVFKKRDRNFRIANFFDRESLEYGGFGHVQTVVLSHPVQNRVIEGAWGLACEDRSASDSYAPNRLGILGQIPGHSQLFIATGWGGTAFKFSLGIAQQMGRIVEQKFSKKREVCV